MAPLVHIVADTLGYREGGGHLWAYLNWALGFREAGCELVWIEPHWPDLDPGAAEDLAGLLHRLGIERLCSYAPEGGRREPEIAALLPVEEAEEADLLVNLAYWVPPALRARSRRSVLVDIDPGMSQVWFSEGDIELADHDLYVTIGEPVANGTADVPDCGVRWQFVPPPVSLREWPATPAPPQGAYSTIAHWWGDDMHLPDGRSFDNGKRASFLGYLDLPRRTGVALELAVSSEDLEDEEALLRRHGWSIADPVASAGTPERYQRYLRRSRGEFSCAKPAYVVLRTGWFSDRTVCYLASGRPAVVQDTGRSPFLDAAEGEGIFRFHSLEGATEALRRIERDHAAQCRQARKLAEELFDARKGAERILTLGL